MKIILHNVVIFLFYLTCFAKITNGDSRKYKCRFKLWTNPYCS